MRIFMGEAEDLVGGRERSIVEQVLPKHDWWEQSRNQEESWTSEDQGSGGW